MRALDQAWRFVNEPEGALCLGWLAILLVVALLSLGCVVQTSQGAYDCRVLSADLTITCVGPLR